LFCVYDLAGGIRLLLHEVCGLPRIMRALIAALCDLSEGEAGIFLVSHSRCSSPAVLTPAARYQTQASVGLAESAAA
jgi:hypothetical protein